MPALEIISGFATAPSTTFTALTMAAGNSNTIRNCPDDSDVKLLQAWTDTQGAGNLRIRSPKLHDNVQGIRLQNTISELAPKLPWGFPQKLYPQDALTLELTGSATAGDIETACFLIYYASLPGIAARFITPDELKQRMVNITGVENTISTGTAGGWSGSEAINVEFDNFKANTDYALMGYENQVECAAIRWLGSDTGNLGVGGPGWIERADLTSEWFIKLSEEFNLPLIPVFNSANRAAFLIDAAQDENGADPIVTSIFAQLSM